MEACCIIGPTKGGTTLMGCLLDAHPELAVFPLEIKFFTHWLETLQYQSMDYAALNRFFFEKSKLRFLGSDRHEADIMNSGQMSPGTFDYQALRLLMEQNEARSRESSGRELFKRYIVDIHAAIEEVEETYGRAKLFVSKEGNHGLSHRAAIENLFPGTKFIVLTRDPRDIYVSMKTIAKMKRKGIRSPTFKPDISPIRYIFENPGKNVKAYSLFGRQELPATNVCFVKYEKLVEDPAEEMRNVARFLGISFSESLCQPTIFGETWHGNASSTQTLSGVSGARRGKWSSTLTHRETRVLEFFLNSYLQQYGYEKSGLPLKRIAVARDIVYTNYNAWPVDFKNISASVKNLIKNGLSTVAGLIACVGKPD